MLSVGRRIAIPPCGYCQLFVGSLTCQHRAMPPATRPRPQPSAPVSTKPDAARIHHLQKASARMHMCLPHAQCARLPPASGGLEQRQASWTLGLRAEDGGAWRAAWRDAGKSSFPQRAGNTRKEGSQCDVLHSARSRLRQVHEVCGHGLVGLQRL